jgi:transposase
MIAMMGRQDAPQGALFYDFSLERIVPEGHLLRRIDGVLDLSGIREELQPFYSADGRPSIDPDLMIRMLLVGYCYGIRSERRLCEEVRFNLAYRWFCRLGLEDPIPDHSTFSKNRHGRFRQSDLFRRLFERVVEACISARLVGAEGFAVDASVIEADASRFHPSDPQEIVWPDEPSRAVREYLAALDAGLPNEDDPEPQAPRKLSETDPASAWTTKGRMRVCFAYAANYLIDNENAVIMDVETTPARMSLEVASTKTMLTRTEARHGIKPKYIAGDTAYGSANLLGWLVKHKIDPHTPVWDKGDREGTFSRSDFIYDAEADHYTCPNGKSLVKHRRNFTTARDKPPKDDLWRYRASQRDCRPCPLKEACCPGQPMRKILRSIHEDARDKAREIMKTEAFERSSKERKKVEMLFAHLKGIHNMSRLRLRGPAGARDEMLLAATAQNLRKLAKLTTQSMPRAA